MLSTQMIWEYVFMGKRKQQVRDIRFYCKFIRKCKKYPWLFNTPIKYLEKCFWRNHETLRVKDYFQAVLLRVGIDPKHPLSHYYDELIGDYLLKQTFLKAYDFKNEVEFEKSVKQFSRANYIVNYYALIREMKPEIVIETGTASGHMTSWILTAMHKNNSGKLLSIDIPPKKDKLTMTTSLSANEVGMLIPQQYRDRWEYYPGDAKILLPRLLIDNDVDIFIHDSLHTRTHMLFEYNCARALMRPGAVIISHDILWNNSFFSFTASHHLKSLSCIADPNLGLTVNMFDDYEKEIGLGAVVNL
jgi:cephalosporin hydroxylase